MSASYYADQIEDRAPKCVCRVTGPLGEGHALRRHHATRKIGEGYYAIAHCGRHSEENVRELKAKILDQDESIRGFLARVHSPEYERNVERLIEAATDALDRVTDYPYREALRAALEAINGK